MKVYGELEQAYLEGSPTGDSSKLGRVSGGANVVSEFDATLTATPKATVGNGASAVRLITAPEVSAVKTELKADDAALAQRITTLEAASPKYLTPIFVRADKSTESYVNASRGPISFVINCQQGVGASSVTSTIPISAIAAAAGISPVVDQVILIRNLVAGVDVGPMIRGYNADPTTFIPVHGLTIRAHSALGIFGYHSIIFDYGAGRYNPSSYYSATTPKAVGTLVAEVEEPESGGTGGASLKFVSSGGVISGYLVVEGVGQRPILSTDTIQITTSWDKYIVFTDTNFNAHSDSVGLAGVHYITGEVCVYEGT